MPSIFKNKKISFIIVSYNSLKFLTDCVNSIIKHTSGEYEIVIVDNNSGENLDEIQNLSTKKIKIIYSDKNTGFGSGVNLGATKTTGDWLCIINPDTHIQGDIHKLSTIDKNTKVIGIALVNQEKQIQAYQYGDFPTPQSLIHNTAKKIWQNPTQDSISVDWVSGGSLCVETSLFRELLGFDERFFMYYEDIDLCRRVRQAGHNIEWTQQITIWHYEGGSESNIINTKKRYYKAQRQYLAKWYGRFWVVLMYQLHLIQLMRVK
ncbi:MAG: glycosyltransferase family 2 protein [Candidatus Paceibacterota bacterium]